MSITLIRAAGRYARLRTQRVYHALAYLGIPAIVLLITLAWFINIHGIRSISYVFMMVGVYAMTILVLRPKVIFIALGLGAVIHGLNDEDITQGAVDGLKTLFKVFFGVLFYFTACMTVLAFISFERSPGIFWGYTAIILTLTSLFAYQNISTGAWMRRIVVTAAIVFSIALAIKLFLPGTFAWMESGLGALDNSAGRRAAAVEFCSQNPNHASCQTQINAPAAPLPQPGGRTLDHQFRVLVTRHWQVVDVLPGTCVEADDIDDIIATRVRKDLTKIKSRSGEDVYVFLTWKRSGTCS